VLLREEGSGILRWAMAGFVKLQEEFKKCGDFVLTEAQRARIDGLLAESDLLRLFVNECLERSDRGDVTCAEIHQAYAECWPLGGSQSDIAHLHAEDVDWSEQTLSYSRQKTDVPALIHFGNDTARVLGMLPTSGPLFPYLIGCAREIARRNSSNVATD